MSDQKVGVAAMGGDAKTVLSRIQDLERHGIEVAWLTTGGAGVDAMSIFSAAAATTDRILMGTCIVPTFPRHPIVTAQQVQVVANIAPGRFRLGLGPSHRPTMKGMFGVDFHTPLTNLKEYVYIVRTLLETGSVDFDGSHYQAHARIPEPVKGVPIMASALRTRSYEFCGAEADGAISWVSPYQFLRDTALPVMRAAAEAAGRPTPPLVAHVPICVSDDSSKVRTAAREQLATYPRLPFYANMFAAAGFPEAVETNSWSDGMIDAVVLHGSEYEVADRIKDIFDYGIGEIIAHVVSVGDEKETWERSVSLLAEVSKSLT